VISRVQLAVAAAFLALAAPASASQVLHVEGNRVVPENDPALPGASAELPFAIPVEIEMILEVE